MVRQPGREVAQLGQRGRDQVGDVEASVPRAGAVVDHAGDDGRQPVVGVGRLLADQVLIDVGHVAEDAGGHGAVDPGLELEEQDQESGPVSEVDAPEHVGLSATELGADVLGVELARRLQGEFVVPVACEVVFKEFNDGGGVGEEELVDLVVLATGEAEQVNVGVGQREASCRARWGRGGPWGHSEPGGMTGPEEVCIWRMGVWIAGSAFLREPRSHIIE